MRKMREERTNSTLPIQYNVVLVCEGGENDREEFGALFTRASPRHPVVPHGLVFQIGEAIQPTISFEIVAHVHEVRRPDIQNGPVTHKHLDEELASQIEGMNENRCMPRRSTNSEGLEGN